MSFRQVQFQTCLLAIQPFSLSLPAKQEFQLLFHPLKKSWKAFWGLLTEIWGSFQPQSTNSVVVLCAESFGQIVLLKGAKNRRNINKLESVCWLLWTQQASTFQPSWGTFALMLTVVSAEGDRVRPLGTLCFKCSKWILTSVISKEVLIQESRATRFTQWAPNYSLFIFTPSACQSPSQAVWGWKDR